MFRYQGARQAAQSNTSCLWAMALLAIAACGSDSDKDDDTDQGPSTAGDASEQSVTLHKCESASREACRSFVTPKGTEVQLGELGAVMEPNVGVGFENPIASGDNGPTACQLFATTFGEDPAETSKLLDTMDLRFDLYTVYRPAKWKKGEKYPLVTWGNGTCAQPEGYGALLRYVASQGFVVVAANSRWVGGATEMLHGLDFMIAANDDPKSPYYQRIDTSKVAAMGHSQGGMGTVNAAMDARVNAVILFNGGTSASKPFLAISGDMDLFTQSGSQLKTAVDAAPKAAYLFYHMVPKTGNFSGHLTLMLQPERVVEPTVAWLKYALLDDAEAKRYFAGANCKLCGHEAEYEYGQHGIE